jgi:hypothetical protein
LKKMRARRLMPIAVLAMAAATVSAQEPGPARETVTATLNGKKVTVDYGRPALRGRSVKELLAQLPANRVWRAGVNDATTLTTESDVMIGGKKVPAGKYTLYLYAPESGNYELLVNSDPGVKTGSGRMWPHIEDYPSVADKEVARVPLKSVKPAENMDRFLIGLTPATGGQSAITLTWGDQSWTADIKPAGK